MKTQILKIHLEVKKTKRTFNTEAPTNGVRLNSQCTQSQISFKYQHFQ